MIKSLIFITTMVALFATEALAEDRFFNPQIEAGFGPHFGIEDDRRPAQQWAVLGGGINQSFVFSNRFQFYRGDDGMRYFITPRFVVDRMPWKYTIFFGENALSGEKTDTHYGYGGEIGFGTYFWGRLWGGASLGMDITRGIGHFNHYYYALTAKIRLVRGLNLGVRTELGKKARVSMVFGL